MNREFSEFENAILFAEKAANSLRGLSSFP
jgi:hypothetical protein